MWVRLNLVLSLEVGTAAGGLSLQCVNLQMWGGRRRAQPQPSRSSRNPSNFSNLDGRDQI